MATISGNAKKIDNNKIDKVIITNYITNQLVEVIIPDINGNWNTTIVAGQYSIIYFSEGQQPICHGPYTVS